MKPLTLISGLFFITFLTYAYLPQQDIVHNPKAIDWHVGQHAYFAKIEITKPLLSHARNINTKARRVV
jgi:hypothetical protein